MLNALFFREIRSSSESKLYTCVELLHGFACFLSKRLMSFVEYKAIVVVRVEITALELSDQGAIGNNCHLTVKLFCLLIYFPHFKIRGKLRHLVSGLGNE